MATTAVRFGAAEPPRPSSADVTVGVNTVVATADVAAPAAVEVSGQVDYITTVVMTIA